jgi:hypothetical protein
MRNWIPACAGMTNEVASRKRVNSHTKVQIGRRPVPGDLTFDMADFAI